MKPQNFKHIIFAAVFFIITNASAQSSKWKKRNLANSGQCSTNSFVDAAFDNSGNTYALGVNLVSNSGFCFAQGNIHVDKINSIGNVTASYDFDFNNLEEEDYPVQIRVDNSANVYVLGYSHNNMILIKLNSNLTFQWEKRFYDLSPVNMGLGFKGIYITGNTSEGAAVVRYAQSNGVWLGYQLYEGAIVNDGAVTADGYATTGKIFSSTNSNDLFVQRYDSTLAIKWKSIFSKVNGNYNDEGIQVKCVNDNIYIGGTTNNSTNSNIGLLLKYNGNGILQWNKLINLSSGISNYVSYDRMTVDANNEDIYLSGFKTTSRILKYNSAGARLWVSSITIAGTDATTINDMTSDASAASAATKIFLVGQNNYTVGGFQHFERCLAYLINAASGTFIYSDYDQGSGTLYDPSFSFSRVKTNNKVTPVEFVALGSGRTEASNPQASGSIGFADCYNSSVLARLSSDEKQFIVSPEPVKDELNITIPANYETLFINSAEGKLIRSEKISNTIMNINVNDLKPGVYIISIMGTLGTLNSKFFKQ